VATLIPAVIPSDCNSPGEREVFSKLRDDSYTQNWIVLHSLDIAQHRKQVAGEIDFVVIIPGKGVLCIEVKACQSLYRDRGMWYYGTNPKPDSKGPFKQASEAMHSLRGYLVKKRPELSHIVFWSGVILPYLDFTSDAVEWHQWQVINRQAYTSQSLGILLERILNSAHKFLTGKSSARWFKPESPGPNDNQCKVISQILRPSFEYYESPRSRIKKELQEVRLYTEDQFSALDHMSTNERVVFVGAAGTGKTLLSIESARRSLGLGRKTLFMCYNRHLGEWIRNQFEQAVEDGLKVGIFHDYMLDLVGIARPNTSSDAFWKKELPELALDKLMNVSNDDQLYDAIIIDEVQDILQRNYLDVLDLSLRGGITKGKWHLFGDFKNQTIFGNGDFSLENFLEERAAHPTFCTLTTNCRNTPRVAEVAANFVNLTDLYKTILRPNSGIMPEVRFYSSANEQCRMLVACLEELRKEKFDSQDVVVLSTHGNEKCVAHSINIQAWKGKLRPYGETTIGGDIRYCSIHAFKGMEAPVIIVTDVDTFENPTARTLFYIAATRALHRLIILANDSIRNEMSKAFSESG